MLSGLSISMAAQTALSLIFSASFHTAKLELKRLPFKFITHL
jgi:hypothetical protein